MLALENFEGKCEVKKTKRKRKKKVGLNSINCFYIFLQNNFTHFSLLDKDQIILKRMKFL